MNIPEDEIPGILKKKLAFCKITTIEELMFADVGNIKSKIAFGRKCEEAYEELRDKYLLGLEPEKKTAPFFKKVHKSNEYLHAIRAFIYAYLGQKKNSKFLPVFESRILSRKRTLGEIGLLYDIERERVRQIETQIKSELSRAFKGHEISKISFHLDEDIVLFIGCVSEYLAANRLVTAEEIQNFLSHTYSISLDDDLKNILFAVLSIAGFQQLALGNRIYFASDEKQCAALDKIFHNIVSQLKDKVSSVRGDDLLIHAKRMAGKGSFDNNSIMKILNTNGFFMEQDGAYQIAFSQLANLPDCVFRVLTERGKPIHFQDLLKEINFRKVGNGEKPISMRTNAGFLSCDKRFAPQGKTGQWGLADWGASQTVEEKILACVRNHNAPIDKKEICRNVADMALYSKTTVYTILHSMIGKSLEYTADGQIILPEWTAIYGKIGKRQTGYDKAAFQEEIEKILSRGKMTGKQIWERTDKSIPMRLFQQRLEACRHVRLSKKKLRKAYEWAGPSTGDGNWINKNNVVRMQKKNREQNAAAQSCLEEIQNLIISPETSNCEFKSTLRWDIRQNTKSVEMEKMVLKTICAFANCDGGTLLIGVDDAGKPMGLQNDYETFSENKDADHFMQHLTNLIKKLIGEAAGSQFVSMQVCPVNGLDVCIVRIKPANEAFFYKDTVQGGSYDRLYVRTNNSTTELTNPSEIFKFLKMRFK